MRIYMQVTTDEYELPEYIADTQVELSRRCGVSPQNIRNCIYEAKRKGIKSKYIVVEYDEK